MAYLVAALRADLNSDASRVPSSNLNCFSMVCRINRGVKSLVVKLFWEMF
jgi:hypothetical protein